MHFLTLAAVDTTAHRSATFSTENFFAIESC